MSPSQYLKAAFLLNSFILIILGGLYLFIPSLSLLDGNQTNETLSLSRIVSLSFIFFGIIAFQVFRSISENNNLIKLISLTYIGLHLVMGFHWFGYHELGFGHTIYNMLPHILLGIIGIVTYFKSK